MDKGRSPSCPNMIRSTPGKVRKRMGYHKVGEFPARINGAFYSRSGSEFVHAGTSAYMDGNILPGSIEAATSGEPITDTGLVDDRSTILAFNGNLVFFDGSCYRSPRQITHEGEQVVYLAPITDSAYCPTVMISKNPDGSAGALLEDVNVLSNAWIEEFCVTLETQAAVDFQLTFTDLFANKPPEVWVLNEDGETWDAKVYETDYTYDAPTGVITFVTAPGKSPVDGVDNVRIKAYKDRSEQASRINKCTIARVYGDTASGVRLFCSGNPDFPNRDFWCAVNDMTYFPDTNYSRLGNEKSAIIGYSVIGGQLATHKDESEGSIYVRQSFLDEDGVQQYQVSSILVGRGAIAKYSFTELSITHEPLFLTRQGIYAITTSDLTQERYDQMRSFFLNGALLKESGLEDAYAVSFKDFYVLAIDGKLYILDGSTKAYTPNEPYSAYQYESFYFTDIHARVMWTFDETLYFGDASGNVFAFHTDPESLASYSDDGAAISAHWQTSALEGNLFYKNKNFKRCSIQLLPAAVTGVTVEVRKRGIWLLLFSVEDKFRYFAFNEIDFSRFSFSTDHYAHTVSSKIKVKKVDKAVFRFSNNAINTPFSVSDVAFEFVESGNFKG